MAFDNIVDAQRILAVLGKRLERFGLTLHPDKTRLVDFRPLMTESTRHPETDWTDLSSSASPMSGDGRGKARQWSGKSRPRAVLPARWPRRASSYQKHGTCHYASSIASLLNDAGPLRLLWRRRQHSTIARIRPPSRADMEEMAVPARSPKRRPMDAPKRNPEPPSSASAKDQPRIRRREQISLVKNRMREIRTSGSVRDGVGNVPIYSAIVPLCGRAQRRRGRI